MLAVAGNLKKKINFFLMLVGKELKNAFPFLLQVVWGHFTPP